MSRNLRLYLSEILTSIGKIESYYACYGLRIIEITERRSIVIPAKLLLHDL
jgi:hypothetical protein